MLSIVAEGRVGKPPESHFVQSSGKTVWKFSLAVNDRFNKEADPTWINVSAWGDRWEKVMPHIEKGGLIAVRGEGKLRTFDSQGERRTVLELDAEAIAFLARAGEKQTQAQPRTQAGTQTRAATTRQRAPREAETAPPDEGQDYGNGDDIPF